MYAMYNPNLRIKNIPLIFILDHKTFINDDLGRFYQFIISGLLFDNYL